MIEYSVRYDAQYEAETMLWVEEKCSDINCPFCKDRPEKVPENIQEIDKNFKYSDILRKDNNERT